MAVNGVYIVQGELNSVLSILRRSHRWPAHQPQLLDEQDPLTRNFVDLREILNTVTDLTDMSPQTFLDPFLDVIRSDQTSGPVTGQALASVGKFLNYGLIDPSVLSAASAVENIAEAVTRARFLATDTGSDEVVLLKILQVLRTLMLTSVGNLLSNEAVCEIMQSCFRICLETRLSELLRKVGESTLADMIQLLFTRLPTFQEDSSHPYIRKLKMRANLFDPNRVRRRKKYKGKGKKLAEGEAKEDEGVKQGEGQNITTTTAPDDPHSNKPVSDQDETAGGSGEAAEDESKVRNMEEEETNRNRNSSITVDLHGAHLGYGSDDGAEQRGIERGGILPPAATESETDNPDATHSAAQSPPRSPSPPVGEQQNETGLAAPPIPSKPALKSQHSASSDDEDDLEVGEKGESRVNERGVRFTVDIPSMDMQTGDKSNNSKTTADGDNGDGGGEDGVDATMHTPYGLPCVRELFRFLISLTNPMDKQNTENMIQMGLGLLTVALEGGADHLGNYTLLLPLVRNELCRSLFHLIMTEKLPLFASTLRVCFLLFESLRGHLKFQLERYLTKLMEIVIAENGNTSYEQKEMTLEALVMLWRIPGFVTELYLNYDCDLYSSNLFEDITKLLSKNAFPVTGLYSTHILSLDALLTVVDTIECHCHHRMMVEHKQKEEVGSTAAAYHSTPASNEGGSSSNNNKNSENASNSIAGVKPNRMPVKPELIPSHQDLIAQKKKKKLLTTGSEMFNNSPSKGIAFLQEHGLLQTPLQPEQVVEWLKENPRLEKRKIADYICSRKNTSVLGAFVKSFNFEGVRIDDALRMFLEAFRLPGEAAEISMVIEHFADHWHSTNDDPFANTDAAFTLAYAVIMLNVDQHNTNAKKQQLPMTINDFSRNVSGVNGGGNFDQDMLQDVYHAIRSDEIVMPAEQTGTIRENYLWKVLLRRGATKDGLFLHAPSGLYDHDLFGLIWGPAIAAMSFVFDNTDGDLILQKAMTGFRKCAAISAHYGLSDVFDNLIISLCKFSQLMLSSSSSTAGGAGGGGTEESSPVMEAQQAQALAISFGANGKSQQAARVLFEMFHSHGDILREGWKNVLEVLLQLYRSKMLPKQLTQVEDFVHPKGWVSIIKESAPKTGPARGDSGILSSFISILGGSSGDPREGRGPSPEELKLIKQAETVISECHPEQIITDSKYLTSEAVGELLKGLVICSACQDKKIVLNESEESKVVFYLELMISITLENRDRLAPFWKTIRAHIYSLLTHYRKNRFLVERTVVGILRLAIRLLFREDIADEVLQSLGLLHLLTPSVFRPLSQEIAYGLHELLRSNAANIHKRHHWAILFGLLQSAGASAFPDKLTTRTNLHSQIIHSQSDQSLSEGDGGEGDDEEEEDESDDVDSGMHDPHDKGYTSDSELLSKSNKQPNAALQQSQAHSGSGEWLMVQSDAESGAVARELTYPTSVGSSSGLGGSLNSANSVNKYSIVLRPGLKRHHPKAFIKACETVAFLVRDAAHITPENFDSCVECLRVFVEASLDGGRYAIMPKVDTDDSNNAGQAKRREKKIRHPDSNHPSVHGSQSMDNIGGESAESGIASLTDSYHQISHQLLDLAHTLHVKAGAIFNSWAQSNPNESEVSGGYLWHNCWRPLLQCMARLCCDCRRQLRTTSLNYLQRAFLIHDMQTSLSPDHWEDCFTKVLFPLLAALLDNISPMDPLGMEETRVRTMALLCKVFLQHLTPLSSLPTFNALWMTILDFMERYMHTDRSDLLSEAIPESLKNMLLVMETAQLFVSTPGLYTLTQDRLGTFLPKLVEEVLPKPPEPPIHSSAAGQQQEQPAATGIIQKQQQSMGAASVLQQSTNPPNPVHLPSGVRELPPPASQQQQQEGHAIQHPPAPQQNPPLPEIPLTEVVVHNGGGGSSSIAAAPPGAGVGVGGGQGGGGGSSTSLLTQPDSIMNTTSIVGGVGVGRVLLLPPVPTQPTSASSAPPPPP